MDKRTCIDDYIDEQNEDIQGYLNQIKESLRRALPGTEERMSYRMPTFWDKKNIIHFAGYKNHIGIYPGPQAIEDFADRLTSYKTSKGAIQIPLDKPIPLDLIRELALYQRERIKSASKN